MEAPLPLRVRQRIRMVKMFVHNSIESLCLNFRFARSAERKQNWLPCSSNSIWGWSKTVFWTGLVDEACPELRPTGAEVDDAWSAGVAEYNGIAKEKTECGFGITSNISAPTSESLRRPTYAWADLSLWQPWTRFQSRGWQYPKDPQDTDFYFGELKLEVILSMIRHEHMGIANL